GPPPIRGPLTATFRGADGAVLATEPLPDGTARWMGEFPAGVTPDHLAAIEVTGTLVPAATGTHTLGVSGVGEFTLTLDGTVLLDGTQELDGADPGAAILSPPSSAHTLHLTAGQPVDVALTARGPFNAIAGAVFVGFALTHVEPRPGDDELIEEAVRVAADADVAIVVAATTEAVESEGFDRTSLALPGRQDDLVARVAAANDRTVAVVNAGAPVVLPWRDDVAAVLLTWFGGQELGAALADVLLGAREPGGRLPTTWPRDEDDAPVLDVRPTDGVLRYTEGLFIGYRAWERAGRTPAFPFGHGLGYTTWSYDAVDIAEPDTADALATVRVRLTNTGERAGREVVQLYLAADHPGADRPARRLAAFATVAAGPGEPAEAVLTVPRRAAESWDAAAHGWRLDAGGYEFQVGRSSADIRRTAPFPVSSAVTMHRVRGAGVTDTR
ncbi:glycoside hydrolase family 3 C-terminal domain-containing protein, partial [Nocardiopsis gilva]